MPHHSHSHATRRLPNSLRLWYIHVFGMRSTCSYVTFSLFNCLVEAMSSYSLLPFHAFSSEITYLPGPFLRLFMTFLPELCRLFARVQKKLLAVIQSTPPAPSFKLSASAPYPKSHVTSSLY